MRSSGDAKVREGDEIDQEGHKDYLRMLVFILTQVGKFREEKKQSAEVYLRLLGGIVISNRFEVVNSPFPGVCKWERHISRGL